jgi:hypothetical protein
MTDWYKQERLAKYQSEIRDGVRELRSRGEAEPVALGIFVESERERVKMEHLAGRNLAEDESVLYVVAGARAAELIDRFVSQGLGTLIMSKPVQPPHAFRLIILAPGELQLFVLVDEGPALQRAATLLFDIATRTLRMNVEGDIWDTLRIDW